MAADAAAQRELMKMHFFSEGRGMHLVPGYLRHYHATAWTGLPRKFVEGRLGFNDANGQVAGLFDVRYKDMTIGVAGCASCHSGKAAGIFYPGLGNKTIDVGQMGTDLGKAQKLYAAITPFHGEKREVEQDGIRFAGKLADPEITNLTRGMVPVALILDRFTGEDRANGSTPLRAAVKVPAFWGYATKREVGLFCDGYGAADPPGWLAQVELAAGQHPDDVRRYLPALARAEQVLSALMPVAYPFDVDQQLAVQGHEIFVENCARCHGEYTRAADGYPRLERPQWIPIDIVGTDPERTRAITDAVDRTARNSDIADILPVQSQHRGGYLAPRLEGIWARFPYLHNGAVPTLRALLDAPENRPGVFSMKNAGERDRFDMETVGLTLPTSREADSIAKRALAGDRNVYDTRRPGHSNRGHEFGIDLSGADKQRLVEYLKTL
jgi:mono/diheme cytochrome c family protein